MLWLIVGSPIAVLLVAAYFVDRKSKRVRGHVGRVSGGALSRRVDAVASGQLSQFDGGPSMNRFLDPYADKRKHG